MESIEGRIAWVLGAGSGIGAACAVALARAGARVILSGRTKASLAETAETIASAGHECAVAPADITDPASLDKVVAGILADHGRIDIALNSAGINTGARHWNNIERSAWHNVIDINVNGVINCASAVLPAMRAQRDGLIITVASWASRYDSYVSGPTYTASKHAALTISASINMEEGGRGIRACALCPAEVATAILDKRPVPPPPEERARMLQPLDVAEAALYVARQPKHVCINEILISPSWNRAYIGGAEFHPQPPED